MRTCVVPSPDCNWSMRSAASVLQRRLCVPRACNAPRGGPSSRSLPDPFKNASQIVYYPLVVTTAGFIPYSRREHGTRRGTRTVRSRTNRTRHGDTPTSTSRRRSRARTANTARLSNSATHTRRANRAGEPQCTHRGTSSTSSGGVLRDARVVDKRLATPTAGAAACRAVPTAVCASMLRWPSLVEVDLRGAIVFDSRLAVRSKRTRKRGGRVCNDRNVNVCLCARCLLAMDG